MTKHSDKIHIKLKNRDKFLVRGVDVPGYIWQERPFHFDPQDFAVGGDRLNEKIFNAGVQTDSLNRFLDNPRAPSVYGVASAPNDMKAKYFAAYLVQHYLENSPPNMTAHWETLYGNSFSNAALDKEPSLLVITGLCPNSSSTKLEKARDLLERHAHIPRIVVIAGEDPVTFFATRLYSPVNNMFFSSAALCKRKVEVV